MKADRKQHTELSRLRHTHTLAVQGPKQPLPLTPLHNVATLGASFDTATETDYQNRKPSALDSSGHAKRNIALAQIGFIFENPDHQEENFISLPVQVPQEPDIYSLGAATQITQTPPRQTIQRFFQVSQEKPTPKRPPRSEPEEVKNNVAYAQRFHHSEQALVRHLNARKTIKNYLQQLSEKIKDFNPQNITGTVLDLYSTRAVCEDCKNSLVGLLSNTSRFMQKLAKKTGKKDLLRGCRVIYKKKTELKSVHDTPQPAFSSEPLIFTQNKKSLPAAPHTPEHNLDLYTVFSSRTEGNTPLKIKTAVTAQLKSQYTPIKLDLPSNSGETDAVKSPSYPQVPDVFDDSVLLGAP